MGIDYLQLSRQADSASQHQGLAGSFEARGDRGFPLARPEAYVGELACAVRDPLARTAGAWRLGECKDGAPVAHLSSEHLAPYVERFSPLRVVTRDGATNWLRIG